MRLFFREQKFALTQQQHLFRCDKLARAQLTQINSAGDCIAFFIYSIPFHAVRSCGLLPAEQSSDFLSLQIENRQFDIGSLRNLIGDFGFRVEGMG